jgi:tape measure domain-containing protein
LVDLGNLSLGVVVADSPLSSLETRLNALERRFGTPLRVSVDTSAATGGMQRLNTETERFSRVMNGIAIGAGLAVFGVLALGAKAAGDAIVGYNDKLDRATAALTGMTGSAAAANKEMAELLQIANATPFSFEQVEKGAIRFQNVGLSAKQAEALIIDTGNAVARFGGTSVEVDHVTLAISQIASKGHVMTQEMNQLAEAGINGFAILAQATGKSEGELRKLAETGGIASSTFLTAFHAWATQPDIASSMERQSHTFSGAMSTISDSLKLAAATGFRPFFDGIVQLANKISAFVQTPWFASFVSHVQAAMAAALDALKSFLSVLAPIGKGILSALGVDTAGLGQQISDQMAHANVPKIDASFGGPSAADTAETDRLTSAIKGADAAILHYRLNVDALSRAMQMNANAQQDVKQGFEDQIAVVQRALDEVNRLSPEEKSRNTRLSQLAIVRMQIEIDKPDTTAIDQTIKDLQEKGKHIGEGTLDGFNAEIDKVNARLHDLGQANTDALDKQIKGIQKQISVIGTDRTLERRIEDLRTLLNKPAVDTTNLNNQMVGLAAQMATNPADRAGLLAQYGNLSRQKQGLITADQQSRLGAQTELQQLEERQRIQTRMDQDRKDSLDKQLTGLQDQRQAILDANEAERKGLQERLYQLNLQKTAQEKINEAAKKQNDLDIAAAEKSKVDLLAPYNAAVKLNDEERRRLELLKAQDDLRRQQAADPLTEQIKDLNQAMKDALDPLERRGRELDRQKQAADNILQDAERQKQLDQESLANLNQRIAAEATLQAQRAKWNAAIMPGGFSPYDEPQITKTALPDSPIVAFFEKLSKAFKTLKDVVENDVLPALGKLKDFVNDNLIQPFIELNKWLDPKIVGALLLVAKTIADDVIPRITDLYHWVEEQVRPAFKDWYELIDSHVGPTLKELARTIGDVLGPVVGTLYTVLHDSLHPILTIIGTYIDSVLAPIWTNLAKGPLEVSRIAFDALNVLITNFVHPAIHDLGVIIDTELRPFVETIADKFEKFGKVLEALKKWVDENWGGVGNALSAPFKIAFAPIAAFFTNLHKAINWLGEHFKLPTIEAPPISQSLDSSPGGGAPGALAKGTKDWRGGWSWVGEQGPELMYVPQHSIVVPNDKSRQMAGGLPGFAEGFNLDILNDALGALGGVIRGAGSKLVDTLMDHLGVPDIPGIEGAGKALVSQIKDGLLDWIKGSDVGQEIGSSVYNSGGSPQFGGQFIKPVDAPFVQGSYGSYSHSQIAAVDWASPYGSPIWAPAAGQVSFWGQNGHSGGTGNTAEIQHDQHWMSLFGHVHQLLKQVGDFVTQGETFARSGAPGIDGGFGSGPHLHYELWHDGARVRPEDYMPMAAGAYVTGPTRAMVGEGSSPEFVLPEPKLNEVLARAATEGGNGTVNVHMAPGAVVINVGARDDARKAGEEAWDGFISHMRETGHVMVG